MNALISTLVPLLIMVLLGYLIRHSALLSAAQSEGLKTLIVTIVLPSILFHAFAHTALSLQSLTATVTMFVVCLALFGYGKWLTQHFSDIFKYQKSTAFMTGYEFGMLGVALISQIWGMDALAAIMPLALGHECFIWFFYVPALRQNHQQSSRLVDILRQMARNPVVVAIVLGLLVNISGLLPSLKQLLIGQVLFASIALLKPLASPVILIYIGYHMAFDRADIRRSLPYTAARWLGSFLAITLVGIVFVLVLKQWSSTVFYGFVTIILLPAPYIIPLFVDDNQTKRFYSQLLMLNTVLSFVAIVILAAITSFVKI